MVTRSHLQLVQPEGQALAGVRARLLSSVGRQPELIRQALEFVEPQYQGRTLASGEPLLAHALDVAQTVSELKLDSDAIAAALLFPAYEGPGDTARVIREKFGSGIGELCEGVVRMAQQKP